MGSNGSCSYGPGMDRIRSIEVSFDAAGSKSLSKIQVDVNLGDLVSIIVGPRSGEHACDLTSIRLTIQQQGDEQRIWDLAEQVSGRLSEGNPLADSYQHDSVWHFYSQSVADIGKDTGQPLVPADSLLAKWQQTSDSSQRRALAEQIQTLAQMQGRLNPSPDAALQDQLRSWIGIDVIEFSDLPVDPRFGRHPKSKIALSFRFHDRGVQHNRVSHSG